LVPAAPKRFVKPPLEDVKAYIREKGYSVDAERWMAHYEANGWRVGRNPMKDWRASVRYWATDGKTKAQQDGFEGVL